MCVCAHGASLVAQRIKRLPAICSVMSDSVNPWTVAHQDPCPWDFSRQEYCNGLPFPSSGDFPDSGIKPESLMSPALAGRFFTYSATWEVHSHNK